MRLMEGRGFLVRSGWDGPWSGWIGVRQLDAKAPLREAPWMALRALGELVQRFPGGLALIWDAPLTWLDELPSETRSAFWGALGHLPGLTLHFRNELPPGLAEGSIQGWVHGIHPPTGFSNRAWRQGWVGWCPELTEETWRLPEQGITLSGGVETMGTLWGEIILPLPALAHLGPDGLLPLIMDAQGPMELALSQRIAAGAWPENFPFHRRRAAWRLAVLGGREFLASGGNWEEGAHQVESLASALASALRAPVVAGVSSDFLAANSLGHQAMREGHPWRYALPMPPASPSFTPGLGADPRDPSPLEARTQFPPAMASVLSHPPIILLRVPSLPQEGAVEAFLRGQQCLPAIQWIPPGEPPQGPFLPERPWAPSSAFTPILDVTQALPQSLFGDWDPDA
ncbi:hypothetical protein [Holophaga foetida]|uniref:hypothetical protein n=1 Tax=Holophaga foetida TaxID=35839 RepID=UPI0002474A4C|nr:hypothetical protein [Holophaga foetida]